jgi:hypothetical protein
MRLDILLSVPRHEMDPVDPDRLQDLEVPRQQRLAIEVE